jgi:hypothetical protein
MALTSVTATATARDGSVLLEWVPDAAPDDRWEITRDGGLVATLLEVLAVEWVDYEVSNGERYSYVLTGQAEDVAAAAVTAVPGPRAYGRINPLETEPRYTTIDDLKPLMNLNVADITRDDDLTRVVIAVELAIDQHLGRSFPDPGAGEIEGIPEAVKQTALSTSVAVFETVGAPFGTAGSDDWLGTIPLDVAEIIKREVRRSPLLTGLRVSFGIAG